MKEEMNLSDLWGGCIWSSSKPQTNADRIRSMSDEELADWFSSIAEDAVLNGGKIKSSVWLSWLKSPM